MNKRQIVASLNKIANELDKNGLYKEASSVTNVMKRIADDGNGDWRDSLLTDDQKSVVQKSKDMEFIFNMFKQYADEILDEHGHSGSSKSFLKGQVVSYFEATDEKRSEMMSNFERISQQGGSINKRMYTHILEFLQFAQKFQNEHNVPDVEMSSFVKAL